MTFRHTCRAAELAEFLGSCSDDGCCFVFLNTCRRRGKKMQLRSSSHFILNIGFLTSEAQTELLLNNLGSEENPKTSTYYLYISPSASKRVECVYMTGKTKINSRKLKIALYLLISFKCNPLQRLPESGSIFLQCLCRGPSSPAIVSLCL